MFLWNMSLTFLIEIRHGAWPADQPVFLSAFVVPRVLELNVSLGLCTTSVKLPSSLSRQLTWQPAATPESFKTFCLYLTRMVFSKDFHSTPFHSYDLASLFGICKCETNILWGGNSNSHQILYE